jgi:tannase/feruloyl esterase
MLSSLAGSVRVVRNALPVLLLLAATSGFAEICESLVSLKLSNTAVTLARVEEGDLSSLDNKTPGGPLTNLPSFCRVAGTISPVPDSVIKFELWMPTSNWNRRFMVVGNGAFSGAPWIRFMAAAVREGYAVAGTDTGHQGSEPDASFALGHPEKVIDFGYRSVHETTVKSKAIVATFYDTPAQKSYFDGCSSGGRQGLMEAQRYPADFDGIISGAPASSMGRQLASAIWIERAAHLTPASNLPKEKLAILHQAALDACDASDGVKDGAIRDPHSCRFDPAITQCKGADASACLTPEQVEAAREIYAGPVNPRTHEKIYPGLEPGSEVTWYAFTKPVFPIASSYFKYIIFKDPKWDADTLNFDSDIAIAEKVDGGTISATNPNLKPFFAHGGKLILYHGLSDGLISPQNTISYYNAVIKAAGPTASQSMRLYLAPGMEHCFGGDGPSNFDLHTPIAAWVENNKAPEAITASHFPPGPPAKPDRTRPLCTYPQVAKYKGSGSTDDAANFACAKP